MNQFQINLVLVVTEHQSNFPMPPKLAMMASL